MFSVSASPTEEPSADQPPAGGCTPEYRRQCLPLVPIPELLPNRPKPAADELAHGMRLVSVALTESRFAGEAWLPADPMQRTIEKPAWLAFAEERGLSRNAAEWAVYRLAELGLVEVVWPQHEQMVQDRSRAAEERAARYRGGRVPTVCAWDLFEDGRILTIRSLPGLWGYAPTTSADRPALNVRASASDRSDPAPPPPAPTAIARQRPTAGHPGDDELDTLLQRVRAAGATPVFLTAREVKLLEVWLKHRNAMKSHPSLSMQFDLGAALQAVLRGPTLEERVEAQLKFNRELAALSADPAPTAAGRELPAAVGAPDPTLPRPTDGWPTAPGAGGPAPPTAAPTPRPDEGRMPAREPVTEPDATPNLDALPERCQRAYRLYLRAVAHFKLTDPTDQSVYDALREWDGRGEPLPAFETWARYLRDARNALEAQKHKPRTRPNPSDVRSAVPIDRQR